MMTALPLTSPRPLSIGRRALYAVPLVGRVARDIARDVDAALYAVVILVTLLVLAVQVWGLAALVLAAVAFVPVMFVLLIWVTLP
jgi:hypothetical protein